MKILPVLILALTMTPCIFGLTSINATTIDDPIKTNMEDLERIYKFAQNNFLYDIDHKKVYEAMAKAMLSAFGDKWTMYIGSDESSTYKESISGKFEGIGIYLTKTSPEAQNQEDEHTLYIVVTSCFKNGPADKAGLMSNDLITHIDGVNVIDKNGTECSTLLRGPKNTTVTVTVKRGEAVFDVEITRDEITTPTAESQMLDGGILYLRINSFAGVTAQQTTEELNRYSDISALILDLRDNGGGDVSNCLEIADLFLDGGKILIKTRSKVKKRNKIYESKSGMSVSENVPILVLINSGTASASEILALSLRENGRAKLVGQKSYGKGVMQVTTPYKDGVVNITTAEYTSGNGVTVNNTGLEPDYPVETEKIEKQEDIDRILKIKKDGTALDFVSEHPDFTQDNVGSGTKMLCEKYGIPEFAAETIIFAEYYKTLDNDEKKVAYPEYDKTLKKAIDILQQK